MLTKMITNIIAVIAIWYSIRCENQTNGATMNENKIITFKPTPAFGRLKRYFTKDSAKHPAKANMLMLEWIIDRYTNEGDTVLDPMAGTFSTCITAAMLGRNAVGVEYENKFYEWGIKNMMKFLGKFTFPHGQLAVVKGDARQLSKILTEQADNIVSSPPYSESLSDKRKGYTKIKQLEHTRQYKGSKDNIGNLPHGDIDAVISSPPHSDTIKGGEGPNAVQMLGDARDHFGYWPIENEKLRAFSNEWQRKWKGYSKDKDNIGNLRHGEIDAVVTSPPFTKQPKGAGITKRIQEDKPSEQDLKTHGNRKNKVWLPRPVSDDPENIENLDYGKIDTVIFSPPYEGGPFDHAGGHGGKYAGGIAQRDEKLRPTELEDENIGNKSGESYLGAMLQVYRESWKVLRPGGIMVLVTKNFIRDKKIVRLDLDTIKLCEAAQFELIDRWYRKLTNFSFWIRNYFNKYGIRVEYEDILVFKKPG